MSRRPSHREFLFLPMEMVRGIAQQYQLCQVITSGNNFLICHMAPCLPSFPWIRRLSLDQPKSGQGDPFKSLLKFDGSFAVSSEPIDAVRTWPTRNLSLGLQCVELAGC